MDRLDFIRDVVARRERRKRMALGAKMRPRIPKRKKDFLREKPPPQQKSTALKNPVIAELDRAVAEKNVERVHHCLDQLWRQPMTAEVSTAISKGQAFCREQSSTL